MSKLKKDKFSRARGGNSKILQITCSSCETLALLYQKDGKGYLHRCYLNRIVSPVTLSELYQNVSKPSEVPKLVCTNCQQIIGTPIRYTDGRIAFRLNIGSYKTSKGEF